MHALLTLVLFLLILGVLIFVHELGHFAVAKWTGMRVDEFAIGFPPRIWSKKKGETTYALNAIPFGGYVRIHGESPESQDEDTNSFDKKSVWSRMAVVLAGVTMNVLFAFVILTVAFSVGFSSISQDLTKVPGAVFTQNKVLVLDLAKGGAAEKAGIKAYDIIQSFTDLATGETKTVVTLQDLTSYTKAEQVAGHLAMTMAYQRNGENLTVPVTLATEGAPLGVYIQPIESVRVPAWRAPVVAAKELWGYMGYIWDSLKGFGAQLFHAKLDPNVSGPVGVYQATGVASSQGLASVIQLIVSLSLSLALLNVLPIPALDGGKFLFLIIEAVAGKRIVGRKFEAVVTAAGFAVLIGLILILSIRDVIHLF
jgi:regulator of sigma E protease